MLDFLYRVGLLWAIIWWLKADSRKRHVKPVYCLGLLVTVGWFIILPHHVFKTRGAKGFLTILIFIGMLIGTQVLGIMAYVMSGGSLK